jgi:hypothetical protein
LHKLFYYTLALCVLFSNTDLVRASTYYFSGAANAEQALAFIQYNGIVDTFYLFVGNAFNYASVFFCWIIFKKHPYLPKFTGLYLGLTASALYFFTSTWDFWMPIAQGANMSENFAMGFLKITLYANIIGLICCMLGLAIGNQKQKKEQ